MLRKIKTNIKSLQKKESSLMDFVMDIKSQFKIKNTENMTKMDRRKLSRAYENYPLKINCDKFNGNLQTELGLRTRKKYNEEKENYDGNNRKNLILVDGKQNTSIKKFFKPLGECKMGKNIEFFDELNRKYLNLPLWEEKELGFPQSKILPKVKLMKVDNDVMTDEEQLNDALKMMRENLKETIKSINLDKDFLSKNLSKKLKYHK